MVNQYNVSQMMSALRKGRPRLESDDEICRRKIIHTSPRNSPHPPVWEALGWSVRSGRHSDVQTPIIRPREGIRGNSFSLFRLTANQMMKRRGLSRYRGIHSRLSPRPRRRMPFLYDSRLATSNAPAICDSVLAALTRLFPPPPPPRRSRFGLESSRLFVASAVDNRITPTGFV